MFPPIKAPVSELTAESGSLIDSCRATSVSVMDEPTAAAVWVAADGQRGLATDFCADKQGNEAAVVNNAQRLSALRRLMDFWKE